MCALVKHSTPVNANNPDAGTGDAILWTGVNDGGRATQRVAPTGH